MAHAVLTEGLGKRFGPRRALDGLDLAVPEGSVLGLLGPNGAGKTTAVRVLTTLLRPDAGRALVAGHDVARDPGAVRRAIGLTGQHATVDDILTGRENLVLWGRLFHLDVRAARHRAGELLERFDLADAADRRAGTYSGGMRRRLDVAGRKVAEGTPSELKSLVGGDRIDLLLRDPADLAAAADLVAAAAAGVVEVDVPVRRISAPVRDRVGALTSVVRALDDAGLAVEDIGVRRPTLDEVFLRLTGHAADRIEATA